MTYQAYVSVDLGRQHDYTAIVVAEEAVWVPDPPVPAPFAAPARIEYEHRWSGVERRGWVSPSALKPYQALFFRDLSYSGSRPGRPPLLVRHLERVRGRPYTAVVDEVIALLARPPLSVLSVGLLVDAGGVGVAVLDLMRQRGLTPWSITATGGDTVNTPEEGVIRCPKRELVAGAQIALAEGRLRIAAGLVHAPTLIKELQGYQVKISATGHDSYAARDGEHDDLVYSAAQLCWFRDWYCANFDDEIAKQGRVAATT